MRDGGLIRFLMDLRRTPEKNWSTGQPANRPTGQLVNWSTGQSEDDVFLPVSRLAGPPMDIIPVPPPRRFAPDLVD
jgi:hypothetical protein